MSAKGGAKHRRQASARSGTVPHTTVLEAPPDWPRPVVVALVLAAFVLGFVALEVRSYTRTSATFDEPGNLAAGYAAVAARDYRPAIEHPPLVRMWAALPLLWMPGTSIDTREFDRASPEALAFSGPFEIGHRFLYAGDRGDRLLYPARFMVVLLGVALGVLLFCWAGEWLGFRPAVIALALYVIEPNIAAHSALVTTDLGVTVFTFGAVYFLWRASRRMTSWNVAGLTICFVLAILSKFSGLILGPVVLLLMVIAARRRGAFSARTIAQIVVLLIVGTWVGAWAAYGFRYAPGTSPGWQFGLQHNPAVIQAVPALASIVGWIDAHHLLPNAFAQGFLHGQGLVQGRPAFLAGSYSDFGWWYYFPAAFLMKTPLALLTLLAIGIVMLSRGRGGPTNGARAFVIVPPALFMAVAMTSSLNIGLRHVLPIYPFVILIAAFGAQALMRTWSRGPVVVFALLLAGVLEFASVYPNNLAFFNLAVGGPSNGYRYLADSNIDWGQDLKPLKNWMDRQGVSHVNLAYFGTAAPGYYGVDCTYIWGTTIPGLVPAHFGPPTLPGYVAISVTLLDGVPFDEGQRDFYKPLRDRTPSADIGGSIRVYWVEEPWWRSQ